VGGNCNNTLLCGPFCSNLNNAASNANWNIGAAHSYQGNTVNAPLYPHRLVEINSVQGGASSKSKVLQRIRKMKSYNHLFEKVIEYDNLYVAIMEASKGKRNRKDVKEIIDNADRHIRIIQKMLIYRTWGPRQHRKVTINEGSHQKTRKIIKPDFRYEQVIQHAVMQVLIPILQKGMYEFSCGSIPGRGPHYAKKHIRRILRDVKNTRYVAQLDIRKFFQSVSTRHLKRKLARLIHDEAFLWLLYTIIDTDADELPIGFYTSQWFANWILTPLDHYIKEVLKVPYYFRYVDDMVLFGSNKKVLHQNVRQIMEYLAPLGLRIKDNWQVYKMAYIKTRGGVAKETGRPLDFMGFIFRRDYITMRRSIYYRIMRAARRIGKKEKPSVHDCRRMLSYMGWLTHTDTYNAYLKYVKPEINVQWMKRYVSKKDKARLKAA